MRYVTMTDERLNAITGLVRERISVSEHDVADFIDGGEDGWPNAEEHQEWIDTADNAEIASWVVSGLR